MKLLSGLAWHYTLSVLLVPKHLCLCQTLAVWLQDHWKVLLARPDRRGSVHEDRGLLPLCLLVPFRADQTGVQPCAGCCIPHRLPPAPKAALARESGCRQPVLGDPELEALLLATAVFGPPLLGGTGACGRRTLFPHLAGGAATERPLPGDTGHCLCPQHAPFPRVCGHGCQPPPLPALGGS